MSKKKTEKSTKKPQATPVNDDPPRGEAGEEKPPESAENFEHTLRRLVASRNRGM
jgi:hypothetical protein